MNILKKALTPFGKYLSSLVPSRHRARYNEIGQNVGLASTLSVDQIHAAVRGAESGNTQMLFSIFSEMLSTDNYLQSLLDGRKRAALKEKPTFIPVEAKSEADVLAAELANRMFLGYAPDDDELDDWQLALGALMDAVLWPKTLLSKRFARSSQPGMRYDLAGLRFVDYQLFDGTQRQFMLAEVEPGFGARTGTFHTPDSACYMIHQGHLGTHNLHKGGPLRSLLFWWLFGSMNRDWWARFLDRFGAPFLVGKFNDGDDEGRAVLESAFSAASKLLGVVVNNETEVDVVQAMGGNATGEAFEKFRDICRREMAILVQGQNLSSESSSTGLGSGTSDLQGQVRDDMTEFDQARLGMTLERLARQFLEINGQYGLVRVQFGGKKSADIVRLGSAMASFKQAGLILADEALPDLSEEVGFKIVRDSAPALGSVTPFSADLAHTANEDAVKTASVRLSRLLRENLAPIREILAASQSTADLESRLGEFMAALSLDDRATVTEELLLALASNGASQPFS